MFFGRDQISGERLQFTDNLLGETQFTSHEQNHLASARSKAKGGIKPLAHNISIGSVVFIKQEGSKFRSRESYIVTDVLNSDMVVIQKMNPNSGHFGSVKYKVKIDKLYPCSIENKNCHVDLDNSSIDGSIHLDHNPCVVPNSKKETLLSSDSDSDSTVDEIVIPQGLTDQPVVNEDQPIYPQRCSSRNRRRPNRYSSVGYDVGSPFSGESDTVANWWPNYPRGTWSPTINN